MGLDSIVYGLLEGVFQLIIDLSNLEIFSQSTINEFANRIYIILGLLMLFKITISFVQMLVNPDRMDDKEQGMGNILKRVIIALALIFLVPSIFDLARDLQNRVLPIIPKVILGVTVDPDSDQEDVAATMQSLGQTLSFYSFLPFFNYDNQTCDDGSILGTGTYLSDSVAAAPVIYSVSSAWEHVNEKNSCSTNKNQYKYEYRWLVSTFVGAYLVFALVGVAIQVAIRAIKFAICEVIAPIPIASYIDPKLSKQTFDNWVSTTISVYTDLFINLAVVYFIVYVAKAVFDKDNLATIYSKLGGSPLRYTFVTLFIIIGLAHFVKQAPQFFTNLLGMKGGNRLADIFKGSAGVFGAAGSTAYAAYRGARDSAKQSADGGEGTSLQRTRAGLGGASAAAQALVNNIKGKKPRESARTALDNVYSKNRKSIALTRNYMKGDTPPGIGTFMTAHGSARSEKINVSHGGYSQKEILEARAGNLDKMASIVSDGRKSFAGHKLTKAYQQAYEAAKARSFDSFVDEERTNIQNDLNTSQTNLNSITQRLDDAYTGRIRMSAEEMESLENQQTDLRNRIQGLNNDLASSDRLQARARTLQTRTINKASKDIDDVQKRLFEISMKGEGSVGSVLTTQDRQMMTVAGLADEHAVWSDGNIAASTQANTRNLQAQINDAMTLDSDLAREFESFGFGQRLDLSQMDLNDEGKLKDAATLASTNLKTSQEYRQAGAVGTYNGNSGGNS